MVEARTKSGGSASEGERQERRTGGDRRLRQHFRLRFLLFGGRRVQGRRYEDRQRILFFDRYQQVQFSIIAGILFFSVMDALLTLYLLGHGAIEINPIMAFYLDVGPYTFLFVKYALTSTGIIILLFFQNFFMKTIRINAGVLLYLVLAAFLGVFSWQIYLIHKLVA